MPENKQPVIQIRLKCSDGTLLCAPAQQLSRSVIIEEQIRKHGDKMDSNSGGSVDVGVSGRVMREILKYCQLSQDSSTDDATTATATTDNDGNSENSFVCSSSHKGGMFVLKATAKGGSSSSKACRKERYERVQQKFIQGLKMDELKQFVKAAHLLKMEDLTNRLCAEIAERITDKSVDEIRENFNIENDWAEDEDERIQQVLEAYDCKDGDDSGLNGFHHVALQGLEQMVPISKLLPALVDRGDDINARENKDLSPLDIAVVMGHDELAKRFIFLGSNLNGRDADGKVALHKAAQNGKIKCIETLIRHGADIDIQDNKGQCPIHYAAQFGSLESMVELAKSGCNYRARASNEIFNNSTPAQMYCLREGQQLKLIEGRLERAFKAGQQSRQKELEPCQELKEEKDDEWDLEDIMKQFNDSPPKTKQTTPTKQKSSKKKKAKKKKQSGENKPRQNPAKAKEDEQVDEVEVEEVESRDDNTTLTESLHYLNNSVDDEYFEVEEGEEFENFMDFPEDSTTFVDRDENELQDQQRLQQIYNLLLNANNQNQIDDNYFDQTESEVEEEEEEDDDDEDEDETQIQGEQKEKNQEVIITTPQSDSQQNQSFQQHQNYQFQQQQQYNYIGEFNSLNSNLKTQFQEAAFNSGDPRQNLQSVSSASNIFSDIQKIDNDGNLQQGKKQYQQQQQQYQSRFLGVIGEQQKRLQQISLDVEKEKNFQNFSDVSVYDLEKVQAYQRAQEEFLLRQDRKSLEQQSQVRYQQMQSADTANQNSYYRGLVLPDEDEVIGAAFSSSIEQPSSLLQIDPRLQTSQDVISNLPSSLYPSPREENNPSPLTPPSISSPQISPYIPQQRHSNIIPPLLSHNSYPAYSSEQTNQNIDCYKSSLYSYQNSNEFRSLPINFEQSDVRWDGPLPLQTSDGEQNRSYSTPVQLNNSGTNNGGTHSVSNSDISMVSPLPQSVLQQQQLQQQRVFFVAEDLIRCPLSFQIFEDPVVAGDGYTYERRAIERWLLENSSSPVTKMELPNKDLVPNLAMRALIKSSDNLQL